MTRFAKFILSLLVGAAPAAGGVVPPSYNFDFVTIGSPGNAAYPGNAEGVGAGRGGVAYEFRIARMEVTTAQWMEYVNTYTVQLPREVDFARPFSWGAVADNSYRGPGKKWKLNPAHPQAALVPVMGISWHEAAEFVNWLNNDKSSSFDAMTHGAYDTSTFTRNPDGTWNDQLYHDPSARYWIPTLDEWRKVSHYDPNRYGPGLGGWWEYSNSSDTPPASGPPGVGETSAGYRVGPDEPQPRSYALGSYPQTRTPWGLLDASGGAGEWLEEPHFPMSLHDRGFEGAEAGSERSRLEWLDTVWGRDSTGPSSGSTFIGLRVASAIPTSASVLPLGLGMMALRGRREQR